MTVSVILRVSPESSKKDCLVYTNEEAVSDLRLAKRELERQVLHLTELVEKKKASATNSARRANVLESGLREAYEELQALRTHLNNVEKRVWQTLQDQYVGR